MSGGLVAEPMCRFLVHFIATSWSNLQACKISSIAGIPKLDRVWQKCNSLKPSVCDQKRVFMLSWGQKIEISLGKVSKGCVWDTSILCKVEII